MILGIFNVMIFKMGQKWKQNHTDSKLYGSFFFNQERLNLLKQMQSTVENFLVRVYKKQVKSWTIVILCHNR